MRKLLTLSICLILTASFAQQNNKKSVFKSFLDGLSGSFESNLKWYNDDEKLGDFTEENRFRANSYLTLDYSFLKKFSVGIQLESYEPMPLLNYDPKYKGTNISTYNLRFKNNIIDLTAGYFYEQFGSGLLLRSFEERQLGINNALRGGRIKYTPTNYLKLTALYGQNKIAFDVAKSAVWGFDGDINLSESLNLSNLNNLSLGVSYVGKGEKLETKGVDFKTNTFPEIIHSFAFRTDIDFGNFYSNLEYTIKGKDISYTPLLKGQQIIPNNYFSGNALLYTLGYTKKGFGFSGTFRRLENMSFFAERTFAKPGKNPYQSLSINYIPTLTKKQDYSLANIYTYQAQPNLIIDDFNGQAGEIGGQLDFYYSIKKGSTLGGKYGTKLAVNFSYWSLLNASFNSSKHTYSADFLKFGKNLSKDFNIELRKKWSKKWSSIFAYVNQTIDKGVSLGGPLVVQGNIKTNIVIAETTYKLKNRKSLRLELQHLWTKKDKKNWVGGTAEFTLNRNISIYASDMYNYGDTKIHYYNFGGSYTKGATRIALNYGRQRGGLVCVGGVCRYVSPSKGLSINLSTSF